MTPVRVGSLQPMPDGLSALWQDGDMTLRRVEMMHPTTGLLDLR